MSEERYPGERRALTAFLRGIKAAAFAHFGRDGLFYRRVERALARGDLEALRGGRIAFQNQPEAVRRELVRALFRGDGAAARRGAAGLKRRPGTPG